jgi:hypothetical protein
MPPIDPSLLQLLSGIGLCIALLGMAAAFIDLIADSAKNDDELPPA